MKKLFKNHIVKYLTAFVMVLGLSLAAVPGTASGNPGSVLAQGGWVYPDTGVIAIEKTARRYGIPRHLQLITNGMEFTFDEPTTICHGFYGAGKGWVPEFRYFWRYKWRPIQAKAYIVEDPSKMTMLACIKAPFSATYALFGYYPQNQDEAKLKPVYTEIVGEVDEQWTAGNPAKIDLIFTPAPDGLQIFSGGVSVGRDQWVNICHPFRQGDLGWKGEIRKMQGDRWVNTFSPSEKVSKPAGEGPPDICTWVGEGTYALFGYLE